MGMTASDTSSGATAPSTRGSGADATGFATTGVGDDPQAERARANSSTEFASQWQHCLLSPLARPRRHIRSYAEALCINHLFTIRAVTLGATCVLSACGTNDSETVGRGEPAELVAEAQLASKKKAVVRVKQSLGPSLPSKTDQAECGDLAVKSVSRVCIETPCKSVRRVCCCDGDGRATRRKAREASR